MSTVVHWFSIVAVLSSSLFLWIYFWCLRKHGIIRVVWVSDMQKVTQKTHNIVSSPKVWIGVRTFNKTIEWFLCFIKTIGLHLSRTVTDISRFIVSRKWRHGIFSAWEALQVIYNCGFSKGNPDFYPCVLACIRPLITDFDIIKLFVSRKWRDIVFLRWGAAGDL